jgi:hypothetical protein
LQSAVDKFPSTIKRAVQGRPGESPADAPLASSLPVMGIGCLREEMSWLFDALRPAHIPARATSHDVPRMRQAAESMAMNGERPAASALLSGGEKNLVQFPPCDKSHAKYAGP